MPDPKPRPVVKLKLSTSSLPPPDAEQPASGTTPKIKLKLGGGSASKDKVSEAAAPSPKLKLSEPKKKKPTLKLSKKRTREDGDADGAPGSASKKARLDSAVKTPKTGRGYIGLKVKGQKPFRPRGEAYDSEDPDAESDPAIEEEFVLRMLPGEDCEYIRQAVTEKNLGPEGANFRVRFLSGDGRRAVVRVRGRIYAATLVDMPCIVEGMKSWDRKAWYKCADICQILLVLGLVNTEHEAMNYPLPAREVDNATWGYAHGLTPPMHWVRKRRFRKRISAHTIEWVEREVDKLFRKDDEAEALSYELFDERRLREASREGSGETGAYEEDTGEGGEQDGYFPRHQTTVPQAAEQVTTVVGDPEDDLAADFEAELEQEAAAQAEAQSGTQHVTEATTPAAEAPGMAGPTDSEAETAAATPAADVTSRDDTGDDDDEEEESEADEEAVAYEDEDELERRADLQRQKDEINDLESAIATQREELDKMKNDILKRKVLQRIQRLEDDLKLKKAAIGEGGDD